MRFANAEITTIDLMRHGEPQGGRMLRGSTDHPLSDTGWQQVTDAVMRHTVEGRPPYDAIVSSPLARCREFALWLGEEFDLPVQVMMIWPSCILVGGKVKPIPRYTSRKASSR